MIVRILQQRRPLLQFFAAVVVGGMLGLSAQQNDPLRDLHIEKKLGESAGVVKATIRTAATGKRPAADRIVRVARSAAAVWPVENGVHFLAAVPKEHGAGYELRYYQHTSGKSRMLGEIGTAAWTLQEMALRDGGYAFVLDGGAEGLVVADSTAIRARLAGATRPQLRKTEMIWTGSGAGGAAWDELLGRKWVGIMSLPGGPYRYAQFLSDGTALLLGASGPSRSGRWETDVQTMTVRLPDGEPVRWPLAGLQEEKGLPAGTRITVRLQEALSSFRSKTGDPVEAVVISPATEDDEIYVPAGSILVGKVADANAVGWGFGHETAKLTLAFEQLRLPNGEIRPIACTLFHVENAREKVTQKGAIQGLRSTGTLGYTARGQISSIAATEPIAFLFTSVAATSILGFTEPEILYPAGTEMIVRTVAPWVTREVHPPTVHELPLTREKREALVRFVQTLPFRTATQRGNKPSDLTNLLFLGSPDALRRAFAAAGWLQADALTADSTFLTMKSIAGSSGYQQAPMSTLLLDGRAPLLTLSKTTNTFSARHHLRIFDMRTEYLGARVLTSSSTQDIGIAFSRKKKTFIHVIDEYIDNERSKVVNDLSFTGCVDGVELLPRPWAPLDAYNSTGDRLRTDGAIAVLQINECTNPKTIQAPTPPLPNRFQRSVRNTVLTIRNDLYRGNVVYQGITGFQKLRAYLNKEGELASGEGNWRKSDATGNAYRGFGDLPPQHVSDPYVAAQEDEGGEEPEADHRWDAPRVEMGVDFGYLRFPNKQLEDAGLAAISSVPDKPSYAIALGSETGDGFSAGIHVTVNSWRWVSNEFSYFYQRGKYTLGALVITDNPDDPFVFAANRVGLISRQAGYGFMLHARPRESRWRPYIVAGPVLQLTSLADAPIRQAHGAFKLGLSNIGLLKAAFDFGRTPPLEGGGSFRPGVMYGGGVKVRLHPRWTLRADFRQTLAENPDMIRDSYEKFRPKDEANDYQVHLFRDAAPGHFFQQRFTLGAAFTF
ncbi:MAG TPA: LssY C-terminal domain-containing protein [Bryobacteraceae bacterium]|nr:LssY C-terminal domain-containing protein [Bryobacteraceae bacterium]